MKRQRAPYLRPLWNAIVVLSIVLVIGLAVAGYEIHHLQTQVNGLQSQVNTLKGGQSYLSGLVRLLVQQASK
jgi:uncharacterized protein YoxC